jgi:hypothetical protein
VLAFISIGSRRLEYFACTSNPNTAWMLQQAGNLLMELDDHDRKVRFLIHDRDAKFPRAFDALLTNDGIKVIRTPIQAPNANAHMERWIGTVRRECLDRLLILGRHAQIPYGLVGDGCRHWRFAGLRVGGFRPVGASRPEPEGPGFRRLCKPSDGLEPSLVSRVRALRRVFALPRDPGATSSRACPRTRHSRP